MILREDYVVRTSKASFGPIICEASSTASEFQRPKIFVSLEGKPLTER